MTTGKEDEVTSSEEASTVDVRIEPKGTNYLQLIIMIFRFVVCVIDSFRKVASMEISSIRKLDCFSFIY